MAFDYKDERTNATLREPRSLPEYEDEANALLIKVRGSFPYDSLALESGIFVLRCMLQRRNSGVEVTEEQLEKACLEMFGPLPGQDAHVVKPKNDAEPGFDYQDQKVTEKLSEPKSLPECEEKANELIVKALGKYPYGHVSLANNVITLRHIIHRKENGEDFTDEQLEEACRTIFR